LVQQGLDIAAASGPGLDGWQLVLTVARLCEFPESLNAALGAALTRTVGFDPAIEPVLTVDVLRFAARQSAASEAPDVKAAASALFADGLKLWAAANPDGSTVQALLRISIDMSRDQQGHFQGETFKKTCTVLSGANERAGAAVRRFVFQAVQQLPFAEAERLWPMLLQVRAV
jgi:hypothetical protein